MATGTESLVIVACVYVGIILVIYLLEPWKRLMTDTEPPKGLRRSDLTSSSYKSKSNAIAPDHSATSAQGSPFLATTWELSRYEKLKMAIMIPTILPLRLTGILLTYLLFMLSIKWLIAPEDTDLSAPLASSLPAWKRLLVNKPFRVILFFMGYYRIKVIGKPCELNEARILIANHSCPIDALVVSSISPASFVAEEDNLHIPLLAYFVRASRLLLFSRGRPESRQAVADEIVRRAHSSDAWPRLLIFPEGTNSNGRALLRFKPGAFLPQVPVQPVLLRYPHRHFYPCWVQQGPPLPMVFLRQLCQFVNYAEIEFLPACPPGSAPGQGADPFQFADRVRHLMADRLGVRAVNQSSDDVVLMTAAMKAGLPMDTADFDLVGFSRDLGIDVREIIILHLQKVARYDQDKDGKLTLQEFRQIIEIEMNVSQTDASPAAIVPTVFQQYTQSSDDKMTFGNYLVAWYEASKKTRSSSQVANALFRYLGPDDTGLLSFEAVNKALRSAIPSASTAEVMQELLRSDLDHDGKLSLDELRQAIVGTNQTQSLMQKLMVWGSFV